MADKTLSQVVGSGARGIGDLIFTTATSLSDNKVLLSCDGSVITPASYPLLEAVLDPAVSASNPYLVAAADGKDMFGRSGDHADLVISGMIDISDDGTVLAGWDDADDFWYQDGTTAAEVIATASVTIANACVSNDGNEILIGYVGDAGGNDLKVNYTTSGGSPSSTTTIESVDSMTSALVMNAMNSAGSSAKVVCLNATDSTLDTYNSGANIGTGYTLHAGYSNTASPTALVDWGYTDDLNTLAFVCSTGCWITANGGTTWTENNTVPDGSIPDRVTVDETDNVYCLNEFSGLGGSAAMRDKVYKTANQGSSWTLVLDASEAASLLLVTSMPKVTFMDIHSDISGNLYVFGVVVFGQGEQANPSMLDHLACWYSEDAGVTWTGRIIEVSFKDYVASAESWRFGRAYLSKDGSTLIASVKTSALMYPNWIDISTGDTLPIVPGHKMVADAP